MGLFSSSSSAAAPPIPDKHDLEKDEVIRSLMQELVSTREELADTRQRNQQLEESHRAAVGARKSAVDKVRELEDVLQLKQGIFDSLERQIALLEKHNAALQLKAAELDALRLQMEEEPISEPDLLHRYEQLVEIFGHVRDSLSCPVCYEPYGRDQAVSLMCGHTFCKSCFSSWEQLHVEVFKQSPQSGQYLGPDCIECRATDVRRGRIRIWSLEEVVRLVDRATRDIASRPYVPKVDPPKPVSGRDLVALEDRLVDVDIDVGAITTPDLPPTPLSEGTPAPAVAAVESTASEDLLGAAAPMDVMDAEPSGPRSEGGEGAGGPLTNPALDVDLSVPAASASSSTFSISDALSRQMLDAHAREREHARLRAQEEDARAALEAQRVKEEEEEREAQQAREQVLVERQRTPYVQVFR